jgi:hypothetical protein
VLTKILEIHGSSRWQEPGPGPDSIPQAVIPDTGSLSRLTSEILEHLIAQGATADRSDIDAFVVALQSRLTTQTAMSFCGLCCRIRK